MKTFASGSLPKTLCVLFGAAALAWPLPAQPETPAPLQSSRWATKIARILARDVENPPPAGAIVFAGSSSIERWHGLAEAFPHVHVLNHGIGGSWLSELAEHADQLVLSYHPRTVVIYAGENDLSSGHTVADVHAAFVRIQEKLRAAEPRPRLVFISLKPSPRRIAFLPQFRELNAMIEEECRKDPSCTFVDAYTPMLNEAGELRPELYAADGLHLSADGYRLWSHLLAPLLGTTEPAAIATAPSAAGADKAETLPPQPAPKPSQAASSDH